MSCTCDDGYIHWVFRISGECMYGLSGQLSFSLGCASIGFWIVTQLPQMIENYRTGRADGLSAYFVLQWALGDSCNLVGCILSGQQVATETYTAIWFVLSDVLLGVQYMYYKLKTRRERRLKRMLRKSFLTNASRRDAGGRGGDEEGHGDVENNRKTARERKRSGARRKAHDSGSEDEGGEESTSSGSSGSSGSGSFTRPLGAAAAMMGGSVCVMTTRSFASPYQAASSATAAMRRGLQDQWMSDSSAVGVAGGAAASALAAVGSYGGGRFRLSFRGCSAPQNRTGFLVAGEAFGYASVVFYIGSRFAQIARNYKRKSVEGLSTTMFVFAVLANLTYAAAIILAGNDQETIMSRLPWLMGSLGTVSLDIIIFIQSFLYADCAPEYASGSESTTPGNPGDMGRSASTESTALLINKQSGRFPIEYHSVGGESFLSKSPLPFSGESPVTVHEPLISSTETTDGSV